MLPIINVLWDFLVNGVFGSVIWASLFILFMLWVLLMSVRVSPAWAFISLAPFSYVLATSGLLGGGWIQALILIVLSSFWAFMLWRLIE